MKLKKLLLLGSGISCACLAPLTSAEEPARMETVVVTANRHETALQQAPASISVIDREELILRNADDLADALTSEVGIAVTSVGQSRRGISIRGMPVNHTLYLVDGQRVSSSNSVMAHTDFELGWLPAAAIERVEVVRGPLSSLYGADALGGVVNTITRVPDEEFYGEISSTLTSLSGDGDTGKANLYLAGPLIKDKLAFSFSGGVFERDNLSSSDDERVSDIEERSTRDGQAKLFWTPDDKQRITFSYAAGDEERERDSRSRSGYYNLHDEIDREQISLSYQGNWNWGHLKLNAYQSNLERQQNRTDEPEPRAPQEVKDQVLDGHVGLFVGLDHFVTVGGQLREETLYEARLTNNGESNADHKNIFIQDEWQLTDALMLVGGLALDNHDEYDNEISPRLYAVYQITDNITFKGGYGEGFRAPSLTQLSADYEVLAAGGRFWVEGNAELDPERSKTYEVGIEYRDSDLLLSGKFFENSLENLVKTICYADCGIRGQERRRYDNIDESRIRGIEAEFKYQLSNQLNVGFNYTYLDTEDLGTNQPLEDRPEHMANVSINWSPIAAMHLRWRTEYVGKQYVGRDNYAPSYDLHYLDMSYAFDEKLTFFAGIENIFDERLQDESDFYSTIEPGREFRVGITASL